ncbi:MAG: amidohydrolase [Planctomycetes bacterium]|nr:amidohydrolase [Planctomycetota bacterium]
MAALGGGAAAQQAYLDAQLDDLVRFYQELHANPELSFREKNTAKRLAAALRQAGAEVTEGVGGHGLVGMLTNGDGPLVMVRADLDALPIAEKTGLPYRSKIYTEDGEGRAAGIMHACGHDIHMSNLVGVARWLVAHRDRWRGRVMLLGQPAEERSGGARAMLDAGLFRRFGKPVAGLAIHVSHDLAAGSIGFGAGAMMANVDSVDVTMFGRGGHGAAPHLTIDPIVQAAQLVLQLQTIVAREIDPTEPAVITVGSIHGGQKHNIIADRCQLQLTVRSYSDAVREHLKQGIVRKAKAVAAGARAPEPAVAFSEATPALINDAQLVARCVAAMRKELGDDKVVPVSRVMTAEDFGRFGRAGVPIFMFRVGSVAAERLAEFRRKAEPPPSLHSGTYYPDAKPTLRASIRATVAALGALLGGH